MKRAGAHWSNTSIPTTASLQKTNRKLARRSASITQTMNAMENGAALQMFFEQGRGTWKLSNGTFITPETADAVIHNPRVVGTGDYLFGDAGTSQTYRWSNLEDQT